MRISFDIKLLSWNPRFCVLHVIKFICQQLTHSLIQIWNWPLVFNIPKWRNIAKSLAACWNFLGGKPVAWVNTGWLTFGTRRDIKERMGDHVSTAALWVSKFLLFQPHFSSPSFSPRPLWDDAHSSHCCWSTLWRCSHSYFNVHLFIYFHKFIEISYMLMIPLLYSLMFCDHSIHFLTIILMRFQKGEITNACV